MPNTALLIKNPLAATHEFKQACQLCYPKTGNHIYMQPHPSALETLGISGTYQWEIHKGRQGHPLQEGKGRALTGTCPLQSTVSTILETLRWARVGSLEGFPNPLFPRKHIPGEVQWGLQDPSEGVWAFLGLQLCVPCPQASGLVTIPTVRALNTSVKGMSSSADSGALRTRSGSASGPGPPKPALWVPTTCAKVGRPEWDWYPATSSSFQAYRETTGEMRELS